MKTVKTEQTPLPFSSCMAYVAYYEEESDGEPQAHAYGDTREAAIDNLAKEYEIGFCTGCDTVMYEQDCENVYLDNGNQYCHSDCLSDSN